MTYLVKILVRRKEGILNPEAKVIEKAAQQLGYNIGNLDKGNHFSYISEQNTKDKAEKEASELCNKLLANIIIDRYEIVSIEEQKNSEK